MAAMTEGAETTCEPVPPPAGGAAVPVQVADRSFRRFLVLAVFLAVAAVFAAVVAEYLLALFVAAIFSTLLHPLYRRVLGPCGGRRGLASAIVLAGFVLAVGIPMVLVVGLVAGEAVSISRSAVPWIRSQLEGPIGTSDLPGWLPFNEALEPYREMLLSRLEDMAGNVGGRIVVGLQAATMGTIQFSITAFVFLYAMFFFLMSGERLFHAALRYLPLDAGDREEVVARGISVTRATLKSILGIGVLQGTLVGLAFWTVGISGAAFWAGVVVVMATVPVLGPPLIWVPAAVWLAAEGRWGEAVGLAAWGAVVVGLVDNILRPRIVGRETQMPDLVVLISSLGGIGMFGALGILIGPIIAAVFFVVLYIYRHTFSDALGGRDGT